MIWSRERFARTCSLVMPVLKVSWLVLLGISIVIWLLQWGVSSIHNARFDTSVDMSTGVVVGFGLFAFVLDSLLSVAWFIIATQCAALAFKGGDPKSWGSAFRDYQQILIEYIRALISMMLWGLFLIIPGFVRWVQLTFACYVSLLNGPYREGRRDALRTSQQIIGPHLLALGSLLTLAYLLIEFVEKLGIEAQWVPLTILFYLVAWFLSLLFSIYLTLTYLHLEKGFETK